MIKKKESSFCKILAAIVIFCLGDLKIYGQSFQNGDLDGIIGGSNTPIGWLQVPFGDPVSNATSSNQATSDLTGLTGPAASSGINGNPYSGNTFTSGLHAAVPAEGLLFREGIMQNLVGLIPGVNYQIRFYQAVVKQENSLDPSGSWSVFADATLLGITAPTYSNQPFNSNSFPWELRTVIFQATNNTHLIKFLPTDDDSNIETTLTPFSAEGVRMGIDSISLIMLQLPPQINIGSDTTICEGESLTLNVNCSGCSYLWQDGSTSSNYEVTQSGTYWVQATNSMGTDTDSIDVSFISPPFVNLGLDTILCNGQTLMLNAINSQASEYLWQDGSIDSSIEILQPGTYWVQVTQNTCLASDTINVNFNTIPNAPIVTSNSPLVCPGNLFVFEADSTTDGYFTWSGPSNFNSNNASNSFIAFPENQGVYEVNVMIDGCVSPSSYVNLSIINLSTIDDIDFPNVMTVNGDGVNDVLNVESYFQTCQEFKLSIFNRWGILVYEYSNGGSPFMGKSMNGEELKDSVYFYILSSKENIKNGYIHIIH